MFQDKVIVLPGKNICIDGGQTRLMIYHGDHGWTLNPFGFKKGSGESEDSVY